MLWLALARAGSAPVRSFRTAARTAAAAATTVQRRRRFRSAATAGEQGGQPSPCECRRAPEAAEAVRSAIVFVGVEHRSDQIRPCPRSGVHSGTLSTHAVLSVHTKGCSGYS